MFGNQRVRLLREDPWRDAQSLAEELYAMMDDRQTVSSGPITINVPEGSLVPPITLNFPDDTLPAISITRQAVPVTSVGQDGQATDEQTQKPVVVVSSTGGTKVYAGTVVSGSGSTYIVSISVGNVAVTQLQIDASETIPVGTSVVVFKEGNVYKMQVPVWA